MLTRYNNTKCAKISKVNAVQSLSQSLIRFYKSKILHLNIKLPKTIFQRPILPEAGKEHFVRDRKFIMFADVSVERCHPLPSI